MSLTKDEHSIRINGHVVSITGATGPIEATWALSVDGRETDSAKAASGDVVLRADLPDGSPVHAAVHQGMLGPTQVAIVYDGEEITRFTGFVL